jgi:hypothetical protein
MFFNENNIIITVIKFQYLLYNEIINQIFR